MFSLIEVTSSLTSRPSDWISDKHTEVDGLQHLPFTGEKDRFNKQRTLKSHFLHEYLIECGNCTFEIKLLFEGIPFLYSIFILYRVRKSATMSM